MKRMIENKPTEERENKGRKYQYFYMFLFLQLSNSIECFVLFFSLTLLGREPYSVMWDKKTKLCKYWWHNPQLYLCTNDQHTYVNGLCVLHPYILVTYHPSPVVRISTQIKKRRITVIPTMQNILLLSPATWRLKVGE